jgi:hypothetical protein
MDHVRSVHIVNAVLLATAAHALMEHGLLTLRVVATVSVQLAMEPSDQITVVVVDTTVVAV